MVILTGNKPSISKLLDLAMLAILPGQERTADEGTAPIRLSSAKLLVMCRFYRDAQTSGDSNAKVLLVV